ncbi:hypothetical protein AEMCBJ_33575 (plasmid) [Cupriavidus necator]
MQLQVMLRLAIKSIFMSKKTAFRFFVADEQRCSLTWSLTIQKNDIYVSHSGSRQDKISLHESGKYQWSVRSEQLASVPFAKNNRHIARWNNPSAPPGSLTRQFFVLIAASELQLNRARPAKQATFLRAPSMGWATRVDFVFFTPETGKQVASTEWYPKPVFEARLPSGRILLVTHSLVPIDQAMAIKFDAVKEMGKLEGKKHEQNASRALARIKDSHGVWGMAEVLISCSPPPNPSSATTDDS